MLCYLRLSCRWAAVQVHEVSLHKYIQILEVLSVVLVTLCWWSLKCYFWSVWFQLDVSEKHPVRCFLRGSRLFCCSIPNALTQALYHVTSTKWQPMNIFLFVFTRWEEVEMFQVTLRWRLVKKDRMAWREWWWWSEMIDNDIIDIVWDCHLISNELK